MADQTTQTTTGTTAATATTKKQAVPSVFATLSPEEVKELQSVLRPEVTAKFPDIVKMLFETPSLSIKEKQYWLQLLPLMTAEQVDKLKNILVTERQKLLDLNRRYEEALQNIGNTQLSPEEQAKRRKDLLKKEEMDDVKEKGAEEELLSTLSKV